MTKRGWKVLRKPQRGAAVTYWSALAGHSVTSWLLPRDAYIARCGGESYHYAVKQPTRFPKAYPGTVFDTKQNALSFRHVRARSKRWVVAEVRYRPSVPPRYIVWTKEDLPAGTRFASQITVIRILEDNAREDTGRPNAAPAR